jgi:anti-anti-sigma factor
MARKKVDLAKFEGKWVNITIRRISLHPKPAETFERLFVKKGKLMLLDETAIKKPGSNLFISVVLDDATEIVGINEMDIVTPAERALARLEFGEPERPQPLQEIRERGKSGITVKLIRSRKDKRVIILRLSGKLSPHEDVGSGLVFMDDLFKTFEIKKPNHKILLLNLAGLVALDAVSIGDIAELYAKAHAQNLEFIICSPNARVKDYLTRTRLVPFWQCYETETDALSALPVQTN